MAFLDALAKAKSANEYKHDQFEFIEIPDDESKMTFSEQEPEEEAAKTVDRENWYIPDDNRPSWGTAADGTVRGVESKQEQERRGLKIRPSTGRDSLLTLWLFY